VPESFVMVTVAPPEVRLLPLASFACTVSTCVEEPSAVMDALVGVRVDAVALAVPGLTVVMVVVPTTAPEVAVIVLPLPEVVGVKVGNVESTPAVNAAEVPVAPAVPAKLTVPVKAFGPELRTLPLASFAVMLTMLPLTDVPVVADAMVVGFITRDANTPGFTVVIVVVPVWLEPSFTVTVREVPATVGVTLTLESTPEVNAAEVPATPAVPPKVTVPVYEVTVLLLASRAVIVMPVMAVPAV